MKIIHTADIHYSREHQAEALASLETIRETAEREAVDLVAIAGDLFDRGIQNSASSGFPALVEKIRQILDICPIVAVQGTPTHDVAGCYDVLQQIDGEYPFVLLEPDQQYMLPLDRALILGCGEPSKEWFLKDKSLGRDEATQAIQGGMQKLLLGLTAQRKEHPDIPCVFIYHGMIAGAKLKEDVYIRPGEITIGRDDLEMVGADYYALGHIHLGQQIGDLPAYYAGSAYPVDWGETEQKGFNLVRFSGGGPAPARVDGAATTVGFLPIVSETHRFPFPHPPRKKICAEAASFPDSMVDHSFEYDMDLAQGVLDGFEVWLSIETDSNTAKRIDPDAEFAWLVDECGALPGSRVTVSIRPTETVRAGEIAEAKRLRDKVVVYAENSGLPITDSILEKADLLEAESQGNGRSTRGAYIRLTRLSLRGAIGIQKGLGVGQVDVDLSQQEDGLVGLVGRNGAGKTTLIENMHPYPEMLTRSGKLADHFALKDSWRDLYFADERTGDSYRAFIQIDGVGQVGRCDYHLYRNGAPITDGRKDSYVEAVAKLFGSLSLYLRSAFVSQKATKQNPELSDATKGEKKALFRELAGLDYLQLYADAAKEKAKALADDITRDEGKVAALRELVETLPEKEQELQRKKGALSDTQEILAVTSTKLNGAEHQRGELQKRAEVHKDVTARLRDVKARQEDLKKQHFETCVSIDGYQQAQEAKSDAEKKVAEHARLTAQERELESKRAYVAKDRERINAKYQHAKDAVADAEREIQERKRKIEESLGALEKDKAVLVVRVDSLNSLLEEKITCPKCGHIFAREQEELDRQLEETQQKILDIDVELAAYEKAEAACDEELSKIPQPEPPELPEFDDNALAEFILAIDAIGIDEVRATVQAAEVAGGKIEEATKLKANIEQQQAALSSDEQELAGKLDAEAVEKLSEVEQTIVDIKRSYDEHDRRKVSLEATIEHIGKEIAGILERKNQLAETAKAIKIAQQQQSEWEWLQRACGPDGIQALELDAMGPGIAEVANRLLEAAYGARFQIEFRTTRIGGTGSKKKQIEDFAIWIYDNHAGSEQLMETLSGGESVWIKRAIYDAFGIIRDRNTGQRFLTCFQDEADGALDPEARVAYFRMLEAAHQEAGRAHTIVITHSPEAQEMLSQKIEMESLRVGAAVGSH